MYVVIPRDMVVHEKKKEKKIENYPSVMNFFVQQLLLKGIYLLSQFL